MQTSSLREEDTSRTSLSRNSKVGKFSFSLCTPKVQVNNRILLNNSSHSLRACFKFIRIIHDASQSSITTTLSLIKTDKNCTNDHSSALKLPKVNFLNRSSVICQSIPPFFFAVMLLEAPTALNLA